MALLATLFNHHSHVMEWHAFGQRLGQVAAATQRMLLQPRHQREAPERVRCGVQQLGQARRGLLQATLGVDFPQGVGCTLFEVLQHHRQHLFVPDGLVSGQDQRGGLAPVRNAADQHHERIQQHQKGKSDELRLSCTRQSPQGRRCKHCHIRHARQRQGAQHKGAGPHHPGEQGGNRQLLAVPGIGEPHHGKTTPGQRQHASVQGRAADGAAGHLGGAAIPEPKPAKQRQAGQRHHDGPPAEEPCGQAVFEAPQNE